MPNIAFYLPLIHKMIDRQSRSGADWEFINEKIADKNTFYYKITVENVITLILELGEERKSYTISEASIIPFGRSSEHYIFNINGYQLRRRVSWDGMWFGHYSENYYNVLYANRSNLEVKYDYKLARMIYDRSKETKLMDSFWIYDLDFNYLSL